jgi:tetratricopeptide (TPR) repeat protein
MWECSECKTPNDDATKICQKCGHQTIAFDCASDNKANSNSPKLNASSSDAPLIKYDYQARSEEGKLLKGEMYASSDTDLADKLREQKLYLTGFKAKNNLTPQENGGKPQKCPACKLNGLNLFSERKLFGLANTAYLKCQNCGAFFAKKGEQYQFSDIVDKNNSVWQEYQNELLSVKEIEDIADGGMSNSKKLALQEKKKEDDIKNWLDGLIAVGFNIDTPIILKKDERIVFPPFPVSLLEPRSIRTGGSGGMSLKVAPGLYVRGGNFKSQSHEEITNIDNGSLILTNKRLVFVGPQHPKDINLDKIISIEPYNDGIGIGISGKNKSIYFGGLDNFQMERETDDGKQGFVLSGKIMKYLIERTIKGGQSPSPIDKLAEAKKHCESGTLYAEKNNFDLAIQEYTKAFDIFPGNTEFHGLILSCRGTCYAQQNKWDEAMADFNKSLEIKPGNVSARINRAILYAQKENYSQAISDLVKAIEIDPKNYTAHFDIGNMYFAQKDYDNALRWYDKAIEINPDYAQAYSNMAVVYFHKNNYDIAWENVHKAQKLNMNIVPAAFLAELQNLSKRTE